MTTTLLDRPQAQPKIAPQAERQIVALHLGEELYGIDIACIHSVLTPQPITPLPNVAACIQGVMNLRGRILPVVDLRARLGLPPLDAERQKSARIIIVETEGLAAGLIVDAVSEVLRLPADAVEPPAALLAGADLRCLDGIGRVPGREGSDEGERLLLLLDIVQTLATGETDALTEATHAFTH